MHNKLSPTEIFIWKIAAVLTIVAGYIHTYTVKENPLNWEVVSSFLLDSVLNLILLFVVGTLIVGPAAILIKIFIQELCGQNS